MVVGLITGVFDLFHQGHRNFINNAFEQCDFLFVGVASDWITKVQKGDSRPVQNQDVRRQRVFEFVGKRPGRVFITDLLDFTSYADLINVFFVGEGQKNVKCRKDIKIISLPRTEGISTTDIIKKGGLR